MVRRCQVLLYTSYLHIIGGIETFIVNYLELLSGSYDIAVLCPKMPEEMVKRICARVPVYRDDRPIECDTLVMIRSMEEIPKNVSYKKSVRMCHACKVHEHWGINQDCDRVVHVSEASKKSFNSQGDVILNPLFKSSKEGLLLVSATRVPALDKGANADRMIKLANMLNNAGINFVWLNFSDAPLEDAPKGFLNVGCYQDIQPFIQKASYLVQLSDYEGFGYSVAEALVNRVPVLVTGFETTKELGVIDGVNGYVIPFDLDFDVNKLLTVPTFDYEYDNDSILKSWKKILGKGKKSPVQSVRVKVPYKDIVLRINLRPGDVVVMPEDRAKEAIKRGYVVKA